MVNECSPCGRLQRSAAQRFPPPTSATQREAVRLSAPQHFRIAAASLLRCCTQFGGNSHGGHRRRYEHSRFSCSHCSHFAAVLAGAPVRGRERAHGTRQKWEQWEHDRNLVERYRSMQQECTRGACSHLKESLGTPRSTTASNGLGACKDACSQLPGTAASTETKNACGWGRAGPRGASRRTPAG